LVVTRALRRTKPNRRVTGSGVEFFTDGRRRGEILPTHSGAGNRKAVRRPCKAVAGR
jgi:hypothetical protein